jgi:transcriptional regulator with XRE-family HTH domain
VLNIKALRKSLGLNQTEFAQKIGRSKNTIINWEQGETSPTQKDIENINQKFGLKVNQIGLQETGVEEPELNYFSKAGLEESLRQFIASQETLIKELRARINDKETIITALREQVDGLQAALAKKNETNS